VSVAVIRTERGAFKFALLSDKAPKTVENFSSLARKGFYANLKFHRVIPGVLIQGGDPAGDGTGGPGYSIKAEFNGHPFGPGTVGMARTSDPDSAGSQFFVARREMSQWNGQYTAFGQVIEGMDVVDAIQKDDRMLEVTVEDVPRDRVPADLLR
jgi:peptidylprolyl isomerase/peptidyl-prolyl cis-trans isomerase B (cyclophilin B)